MGNPTSLKQGKLLILQAVSNLKVGKTHCCYLTKKEESTDEILK